MIRKITQFLRRIHFTGSDQDKDIIRNELFHANLLRWKVFSFVIIPINLFHIIKFYIQLDNSDPGIFRWQVEIIGMHCILALIGLFFGIYSVLSIRKKRSARQLDLILAVLFYFVLLVIGALISAVDQEVTDAITPYMIASIGAALLVYTRPWTAVVVALVSYLIFFFTIGLFQGDPEVVISNQVNGLTMAGLSVGLSLILWTTGMTAARQRRLIDSQRAQLQKANATKDQFLSILGHDLVGPIGGISAYLEILEHELKNGQDMSDFIPAVEKMRESADNTHRLVQNLLEWSRTQREQIEFKPEILEAGSIVDHAMNTVHSQAEKKGISIAVKNPGGSAKVLGDANMLETVFRNLLSNAIKFTYPAGKVEVTIVSLGNRVVIRFIDNGIGMTHEQKESIFDYGKKTTSKGTNNEPGTGLGLVLCQEFVKQHKGTLRVESELGQGSVFIVELPTISET